MRPQFADTLMDTTLVTMKPDLSSNYPWTNPRPQGSASQRRLRHRGTSRSWLPRSCPYSPQGPPPRPIPPLVGSAIADHPTFQSRGSFASEGLMPPMAPGGAATAVSVVDGFTAE
jgi:hypothetical protein